MKHRDTVSEIAQLFHTSASALRYWEEAGLLHFDRDEENQYRLPTYQTLMDLCEVLFYRGISIPIKDILRLRAMDAASLENQLDTSQKSLEKQIEGLQSSVTKIKNMKRTLKRLQQLQDQGFTRVTCRLPTILPFSFQDADAISTYIHDSYNSVLYLDETVSKPQYGLFQSLENKEGSPGKDIRDCCLSQAALLRPADSQDTLYLHGILEVESYSPLPLNAGDFQKEARRQGYRPGGFIGRYLVSLCPQEGASRHEYYETWMEITPAL